MWFNSKASIHLLPIFTIQYQDFWNRTALNQDKCWLKQGLVQEQNNHLCTSVPQAWLIFNLANKKVHTALQVMVIIQKFHIKSTTDFNRKLLEEIQRCISIFVSVFILMNPSRLTYNKHLVNIPLLVYSFTKMNHLWIRKHVFRNMESPIKACRRNIVNTFKYSAYH